MEGLTSLACLVIHPATDWPWRSAQQTLPAASVHAGLTPGLAEIPPTNQGSSSPAVGWVNPGPGLDRVRVVVPDFCSPGSVPEWVGRAVSCSGQSVDGFREEKEAGGQPGGQLRGRQVVSCSLWLRGDRPWGACALCPGLRPACLDTG